MTQLSVEIQQQEPLSAVPLLMKGSKERTLRDSRCSAVKIIIIIGFVTIVLISLAVVASFVLLTVYSSSIIDQSRNITNKHFNETDQSSTSMSLEDNPLEAFAGDWKLVHQENFEEFLYIIGVNYFIRKIAPIFSTEVSVIVHGPSEVTMTFKGLVSISKRIPFNQEFEEKTPDGRNVKSTHTIEGSTWILIERWYGGDGAERSAKYVHRIIKGEFVLTIFADDLICTRTYVRIED